MSASTSPEQAPLYERKEREGPLSFSTKFYQGIGAIPDTIKNLVFNTFVLLFYNQILGVEPVLVSVALAISVAFDAITDPVVATLSDHAVTRYGRRHPLMLISALPLGVCLYAVFVPPAGFSEMQLFGWLLAFTLLTRGFMTLYFVPWSAIAAELSDDYFERTSVMAFRFAVGWLVGGSFPLFVYIYIMPATPEFPAGQLNPAGYAPMALLAGCILSAGALATTCWTVCLVGWAVVCWAAAFRVFQWATKRTALHRDLGDFKMTVFEAQQTRAMNAQPAAHHNMPVKELSIADMISSGAYKLVVGIERLVRH